MWVRTILASRSFMISEPRAVRTILCGRLLMPWRLRAGPILILPEAVTRKRFLALLLVFILGIFFPFNSLRGPGGPDRAGRACPYRPGRGRRPYSGKAGL